MAKNDLESRKNKERNRIKRLMKEAGAEEWKIKLYQQVIENTAWMAVKLEDTIAVIKNSEIAISYNNGGGQSGIRQNPLFQGYESLWKAYMTGMSQIMSAADVKKDEKSTDLRPKTVLSIIRGEQKKTKREYWGNCVIGYYKY